MPLLLGQARLNFAVSRMKGTLHLEFVLPLIAALILLGCKPSQTDEAFGRRFDDTGAAMTLDIVIPFAHAASAP